MNDDLTAKQRSDSQTSVQRSTLTDLSTAQYTHRPQYSAVHSQTSVQRSTLKDLRDDGRIAIYRGTQLFSKREQQPNQRDTAAVNNGHSDDDAICNDVDEVRLTGTDRQTDKQTDRQTDRQTGTDR